MLSSVSIVCKDRECMAWHAYQVQNVIRESHIKLI